MGLDMLLRDIKTDVGGYSNIFGYFGYFLVTSSIVVCIICDCTRYHVVSCDTKVVSRDTKENIT